MSSNPLLLLFVHLASFFFFFLTLLNFSLISNREKNALSVLEKQGIVGMIAPPSFSSSPS